MASEYYVDHYIDLSGLESVTIRGAPGGGTTFRAMPGARLTVLLFNRAASARPVRGLTFEDLNFDGSLISASGRASGEREYDPSTGIERPIVLNGSRIPGQSLAEVSDVVIRNCRFYGTRHLPVMICGVSGSTRMTDCRIERCKDPVFTFCENVTFSNNRVAFSADNGVSTERGNVGVTVSNNVITDPYNWGICISGFPASPSRPDVWLPAATGARNVTVNDNLITNAGRGGLHAAFAPRDAVFERNRILGATHGVYGEHAPYGIGAMVQGMNLADPSADPNTESTHRASNIVFRDNLFEDCARGGVVVWSASNITVARNTIRRPGMASVPGSAASPDPRETGFGVASPGAGASGIAIREHVSDVRCWDNLIVDDRRDSEKGLLHGTYHPDVMRWSDRDNRIIGSALALAG